MKRFVYLLVIAFFLNGCAGSFKSVNPSTFHYTTKSENSDAELFYKYDVLRERGNKKYSKKEFNAGLRLVAIRITNTTGRTIRIGQDAKIYAGDSEVRLWPPDLIHKKLKQTVPLYLLYLLLTPLEFTTESNSYPIGYIVGPGLAAGNITVAATGNAKLKQELMEFDLYEKPIPPGETAYGLIGIPELEFVPLRIVLKP